MLIQTGNILDIRSGIIVHQVNRKGVMGAGLALQIRKRYPHVFNSYQRWIKTMHPSMGSILIVPVSDSISVCNLLGQDGFGRHKLQTDYSALSQGFASIYQYSIDNCLDVYIPYKIGCGLAGGHWPTVSSIIQAHCPSATIIKL